MTVAQKSYAFKDVHCPINDNSGSNTYCGGNHRYQELYLPLFDVIWSSMTSLNSSIKGIVNSSRPLVSWLRMKGICHPLKNSPAPIVNSSCRTCHGVTYFRSPIIKPLTKFNKHILLTSATRWLKLSSFSPALRNSSTSWSLQINTWFSLNVGTWKAPVLSLCS